MIRQRSEIETLRTKARYIPRVDRFDVRVVGLELWQSFMNNVRRRQLPNFGHDGILLHFEKGGFVEVVDLWYQRALHDGSTFVIFDVASPNGAIQLDFFRESLLLEVTDGVVVCVCEEMCHGRVCFLDVGFEVIHQHTTVSLPSSVDFPEE